MVFHFPGTVSRLLPASLIAGVAFWFAACSRPAPSPGGFAEFDRRARAGESLSVAFLGGSLTWGAQATDPQQTSYRALIARRLGEAYPGARFDFRDAAIGGTGSQLGAFRLDRDVLAHRPDLVFLDFTINDDPFIAPDPDRLAAYESLVRRMVQQGAAVVQVLFPAKADVLPNPPERLLDARHKEIGRAYGLPVADVVAFVQARVAAGTATPDQLWDTPRDGFHPGDAGYALYAEAVWNTLQEAIAQRTQSRVPPVMLHADTYMTVNRFRLASLDKLPRGWGPSPPGRTGICFDFTPSRWMGTLAAAARGEGQAESPAPLVLNVRGRNLLLFGEATPRSGRCRVLVDGKETRICNFGGFSPQGNARFEEMVAQGLDPSITHRVELIPVLEPGQELRIESLCVAGGEAEVEKAAY